MLRSSLRTGSGHLNMHAQRSQVLAGSPVSLWHHPAFSMLHRLRMGRENSNVQPRDYKRLV